MAAMACEICKNKMNKSYKSRCNGLSLCISCYLDEDLNIGRKEKKEKKRVKKEELLKRIKQLEETVETIWMHPDMPGGKLEFIEAQEELEEEEEESMSHKK